MSKLQFTPQHITKRLISDLPDRAKDVIIKRYALGDKDEIMTLEAIGNMYDITRERVRQIQEHALDTIRESEYANEAQGHFDELRDVLHELGVIVPEHSFLTHVHDDEESRKHTYLLLEVGDHFTRHKENDNFTHRWHIDEKTAESVHDALHQLHDNVEMDELVSEEEILDRFTSVLDTSHPDHENDEDVLLRWLDLSKVVDENPLGEWGLAESPNVSVKGMRDYAYLVIREHGSPMHFTEVTEKIEESFDKQAHVATCHNELIKDDRFVLVGRGLYALKEWGYMTGVVRDVIRKLIEEHGPMEKDEIVDRVLKERYVKKNTVIVNLQDTDHFRQRDDGKYEVAK
ncbi:MAG: hypothetical protein BRC24_01490 [Parcubacteria group bacterium SW_4_46_8]|nr:MAG: hypothetical protein BRC24_01490 [Parcubacteria group bacterium SW_4_46_8]